jgi:dihydrofolate synthase/folylpolyglutamate synthase
MASAESYLKTLQRFGIKPGLERIRAMMEWASEPHRTFPSVLIGGTNGKGSVTAFLSAIPSIRWLPRRRLHFAPSRGLP